MMSYELGINDLPAIAWTSVCRHLGDGDVAALRRVSRRLSAHIDWGAVFVDRLRAAACAWRPADSVTYSAEERYKAARQWQRRQFTVSQVMRFGRRQMSWLARGEDGRLLVGQDAAVVAVDARPGQLRRAFALSVGGDVTKFAAAGGAVVAGTSAGQVCVWPHPSRSRRRRGERRRVAAHSSTVHGVDVSGDGRLVASASRDRTVKLWSAELAARHTFHLADRVWTVRLSPDATRMAVGTACCAAEREALPMYDLTRCVKWASLKTGEWRRGAGAADVLFESEHSLLSCGYDSVLRLWDLRTAKCVWSWEEPCNNSLYCMDTDCLNSVLVGSSRHGLVWLLDKRNSRFNKGVYLTEANQSVYGVSLNTKELFASTDFGVQCARLLQ